MSEGSSKRQKKPLRVRMLRLFGVKGDKEMQVFIRLLGIFAQYRRKILKANLLFVMSSFIGVFSILAFLPVLQVIFEDQIPEKYRPETEQTAPAPQEEASASGAGLVEKQKAAAYEQLKTAPLIGPLIVSGEKKVNEWKTRGDALRQRFYIYLFSHKFEGILYIILTLVAVTLIGSIMSYFANKSMLETENSALQKMTERLYEHCIHLDMYFYNRHTTGTLLTRLYNEVNMLRQPLQLFFGSTVKEPVTLLFLTIALFIINPYITLIMMILLPLAILPAAALSRKIRQISRTEVAKDVYVVDLMESAFTGIKVVKAFGAENFEVRRFAAANKQLFEKRLRSKLLQTMAESSTHLMSVVSVAGALLLGSLMLFKWHVIENGAEFILYLIVLNGFYKPVKTLSKVHVNLQRGLASAERIFELFDERPVIVEPENPRPWPEDWKTIEFRDITFSYARPKDEKTKAISESDLLDPGALALKLKTPPDDFCAYLRERLSPETLEFLASWQPQALIPEKAVKSLVRDLKRILREERLFDHPGFLPDGLPEPVRRLIARNPQGRDVEFLNRETLQRRLPEEIQMRAFYHEVLTNVTFSIPRGKTTALIGRNGSGKSTIASLLCRFYLPEQGAIQIGQAPLNEIATPELRRRISLLSQETILFNMPVMDNIAYGAETVDMERVEWAAQATRAHDFIARLPQGYKTLVGERGGRLSGGQRQLIALARVLYHDPEILILDEPEASLDAKHQKIFWEILERVVANRTVIVITHHLPSAFAVDHIFVVDQHKVRPLSEQERSPGALAEIFK